MDEIKRFKSFSATTFASLLVAASYQIDEVSSLFPGMPSLMLAALSGILGGGLGHLLAGGLVASRQLRSIIVGGKNVEGYWFVETKVNDADETSSTEAGSAPLMFPGVLCLSYDPGVDYFKVHTARLDAAGRLFSTYSEIAHIRRDGTKFRYLNYFKLTRDNSDRFGISHGSLETREDDSLSPDQMVAQIFTEDSRPRRQIGTKIPWATVNKYKGKHKDGWISAYLRDHATASGSQ